MVEDGYGSSAIVANLVASLFVVVALIVPDTSVIFKITIVSLFLSSVLCSRVKYGVLKRMTYYLTCFLGILSITTAFGSHLGIDIFLPFLASSIVSSFMYGTDFVADIEILDTSMLKVLAVLSFVGTLPVLGFNIAAILILAILCGGAVALASASVIYLQKVSYYFIWLYGMIPTVSLLKFIGFSSAWSYCLGICIVFLALNLSLNHEL